MMMMMIVQGTDGQKGRSTKTDKEEKVKHQ